MLNVIRDRFKGRLLWVKEPLRKYRKSRKKHVSEHIVDWEPILARDSTLWRESLASSENGPRVLIGTTMGGIRVMSNGDTLLAVALTLRGARVHGLICDNHQPACHVQVISRQPERPIYNKQGAVQQFCDNCYPAISRRYSSLGLPLHRYSELTTPAGIAEAGRVADSLALGEIDSFHWHDIPVGEHALAGTIRYFGSTRLDEEPTGEAIARKYLKSALMVTMAMEKLCGTFDFKVLVNSHGIYVPQGLVSEVARHHGVRTVIWHPAYRKQCLIFSEDDTYHKTLLHEPVSAWENMKWNDDLDAQITEYLDSRQFGRGDWISFNREPDQESLDLVRRMGVDFSRPCIGLLTNVAWDAQLHYGASPFKDMTDWVLQTIAYFARRPDLQLIVRVHPAEVKGSVNSRQRSVEDIKRVFPALPPNVFVIPPESAISTYETMAQCNAVIIYATKTGIELAARGTPVITAGESWVKNKGFAFDAKSPEEYYALLDRLPFAERLSPEETRRARMYAYHFFFRRMIPVPAFAEADNSNFDLDIESLEELLPGRSPGLDMICDGILNGSGFIYPAETVGARRILQLA
jgi:Capsule polysaccharide biosynthesis protein